MPLSIMKCLRSLHSPACVQLAHCQLLTLLHVRAQAFSDHDDDSSQANNIIERGENREGGRKAQRTKQELKPTAIVSSWPRACKQKKRRAQLGLAMIYAAQSQPIVRHSDLIKAGPASLLATKP